MSSATAQPDPAPKADRRIVRAEEQLAMLREMADVSMAVLRAVGRHAIEGLDAPAAAVSAPTPETTTTTTTGAATTPAKPTAAHLDPVERIAKLSRVIRLTFMLEARLEDALSAYKAGEVVKTETRRAEAGNDPFAPLKSGRKARARDLVREAIDRETLDVEHRDALLYALDEHLLWDEAYGAIDDVALRDIVEHLCQDLELKPDWGLWAGEGWKPSPPFARPRWSVFAAERRTAIRQDLAEPRLSG